jgi:hypothetical protein
MKLYRADGYDYLHDLNYYKDVIDDEGFHLYEQKMMVGADEFFCSRENEVFMRGEGACELCKSYSPRNYKSGRCRYHKNLYEDSGREFLLTGDLKLKELLEVKYEVVQD